MRKVLIISYHFGEGATAAGLRAFGLAKYLPEFGWESVILTAVSSESANYPFHIVKTPYSDSLLWAKKILNLNPHETLMSQISELKNKLHITSPRSPLDFVLRVIGEFTAYPDVQKGWKNHAVKEGNEILRSQDIDAIISTSPPATSHRIAKELTNTYDIPWVADFRDLWTQNHYYPYSSFRKWIETRLEMKTLTPIKAMVTTSEPFSFKMNELHKGKDIYSIPNGFDPDDMNDGTVQLSQKFTITYTGNLYPVKQSPELLFAALNDLIIEKKININEIEVRFYGAIAGWIEKLANDYGLGDIVKQNGKVARKDALQKQKESQLLLLLKWDDPNQSGVYTAKIFEYLAAKRPIIGISGYEDVVDDLLKNTKAGTSGRIKEEIKTLIIKYYQQYKLTGSVEYEGIENEIMKYSHKEMSRIFSNVLDSIL